MSRYEPKNLTVFFGGITVDASHFDFDDHSSRVVTVRIANIVLIVLVLFTVSLRLFAKVKYVHRVFADDILIILAAALTIAFASTCITATFHGLGTHIWVLPFIDIIEGMKNCILNIFRIAELYPRREPSNSWGLTHLQYLYVCQILHACATALTKIAIVSSYLRLIQHRGFRITMYATLVVVIGLWVTGVFVTVFQCIPIPEAWDFAISRKCIDYIRYLYASSVLNVSTDIILFTVPIPYLWRLNILRKQRIILCVLFAGGARHVHSIVG